jgi:hypothetical protein
MPGSYATWEDVQDRWRTLSTTEETTATARLAEASALLRILIPDLEDRLAAENDPAGDLATMIKGKAVDAVLRVLQNPEGARQKSESAGPFSHSMTLAGQPSTGVYFTDDELMPLRPSVQAIGTSYVGVRRGWDARTAYRGQGQQPYGGSDPTARPFSEWWGW